MLPFLTNSLDASTKKMLVSFDLFFLKVIIQVEIVVPKNKLSGSWIIESMAFSFWTKYYLISGSLLLSDLFKMPGNTTIAATPYEAK